MKPVIGLEIHIELKTKSKMFCSCRNDFTEKPNEHICPICMAHPGTLPVINKQAVCMVVKTGLALGCSINRNSYFERKNYFYPDLPKGYQISQYMLPICRNGSLGDVGITRVHLEEDTGRLIHTKDSSLVDFNRAGVPLMELVTEPDIHSGKQARDFVKYLQLILRYLDVSNADMEKGELRAEVNISVAEKGLGTKVEIKNLNSIRVVEKAIDYEIKRQTELLKKGQKVIQETRGWHDKDEKTFSQRTKEQSHDYRYFPEPDLPPLQLDDEFINEIRAEIPELPDKKEQRLKQEYGLKQVELFVFNADLGDYFEQVVSELREWAKTKNIKNEDKLIKLACNYISSDLQALLKDSEECSISAENFAEFITMIYKKEISSKIAKILLKAMFETGEDPSQIVEDKGLKLITDEKQIKGVVEQVIKENTEAVEQYKKGKQNALHFLIGQVMAKTKGTAEPDEAKKILYDKLNTKNI